MCSNACTDVRVGGGLDPLLLPAAIQSTERESAETDSRVYCVPLDAVTATGRLTVLPTLESSVTSLSDGDHMITPADHTHSVF